MANSMRWFPVVLVFCGGLLGCKSGPTWDWWRMGSAGPADSSPIARSAGPALPSELAEQGNTSLAGGNLQSPVIEAGGEAPAYGGQASPYTPANNMAANGYPSTGGGYPTTGTSANSVAGVYAGGATTDPFASGSGAATAPVQHGYYDPNAYGEVAQMAATPPSVTEADRYAANSSVYGGPSQSGGNGMSTATQWPSQSASSTPGGIGGSGIGASGSVGTTYESTNSRSMAGGYGEASSPATYASTPEAGARRYESGGAGNYVQATGVDYGNTTASPNAMAGYTSNVAANNSASPAHYRPGGTSDYEATGNASQINVAARDGVQGGSQPAGSPSVGDAPTYRYGQSPYSESGVGQRY